MFKDLPTINSMFFDDLNDAMKFAKEKESDVRVTRVSVYKVLHAYYDDSE